VDAVQERLERAGLRLAMHAQRNISPSGVLTRQRPLGPAVPDQVEPEVLVDGG